MESKTLFLDRIYLTILDKPCTLWVLVTLLYYRSGIVSYLGAYIVQVSCGFIHYRSCAPGGAASTHQQRAAQTHGI